MAVWHLPPAYKVEAVLKALLQSPLLILINACFCMAVSLRGEEADSSALQSEEPTIPTGASFASELIQVNAGGRVLRAGAAPVSPAMQCVISLTIQYFVVYLGLQIAKTYNQLKPQHVPKTSLEEVFENACSSVNFCPMLAVLFIGVRMRAVQLGTTPQPWAQSWMFICTYSILGQTILALVGGFILPDPKQEQKKSSSIVNWVVSALQTALMIGLYAGFTFVILSTFMIQANQGNKNCPDCPAYTAPVPPAIQCTINLTAQYFAVYLALNIVRIYNRVQNKGHKTSIEVILADAVPTLAFCPMLAVLFIGVRMRAIQIGLEAPQKEAQSAFYLCTYAILVQTLMVLLTPYFAGAGSAQVDSDGKATARTEEVSVVAYLTTFIRYAALVALYLGVCILIYCVLVMQTPEHKGGAAKTPPVSPAMLCVMNLTMQFFVIHLLLALVKSYNELVLNGQTNNAERVLESALPTMALIPMLSILFIGARLRALELDPVNGSPQKWAQVCMFICSYAILVQCICSLAQPFFTGELKSVDDTDDLRGMEGEEETLADLADHEDSAENPIWKYLAWGFTGLKFAAMLCVYSGLTAIIISVLIIQPPPKGAR